MGHLGRPEGYDTMYSFKNVQKWLQDSFISDRRDDGRSINVILVKDIREIENHIPNTCLLYTSPSPRDRTRSRMPSSA